MEVKIGRGRLWLDIIMECAAFDNDLPLGARPPGPLPPGAVSRSRPSSCSRSSERRRAPPTRRVWAHRRRPTPRFAGVGWDRARCVRFAVGEFAAPVVGQGMLGLSEGWGAHHTSRHTHIIARTCRFTLMTAPSSIISLIRASGLVRSCPSVQSISGRKKPRFE